MQFGLKAPMPAKQAKLKLLIEADFGITKFTGSDKDRKALESLFNDNQQTFIDEFKAQSKFIKLAILEAS